MTKDLDGTTAEALRAQSPKFGRSFALAASTLHVGDETARSLARGERGAVTTHDGGWVVQLVGELPDDLEALRRWAGDLGYRFALLVPGGPTLPGLKVQPL